MLYLLIGALLALLVVREILHERQVKAERAHHSEQQNKTIRLLDAAHGHIRGLTNQMILLKVEPKTAAAVVAGEMAPEDLGPLTDEELAELELERIEARQ